MMEAEQRTYEWRTEQPQVPVAFLFATRPEVAPSSVLCLDVAPKAPLAEVSGMCEMRAFNCRNGFSLIELLVVLLIVTILLAIVIPVVGSTRRSAKAAACASNLRQIGQAIQTYRSEFRHWPDACPMPA